MTFCIVTVYIFLIIYNYLLFIDFFRKENDDRKKNLEDVNDWIRTENEKRMAEAEALRAR